MVSDHYNPASGQRDGPAGDRLESWKEIAVYLNRTVRTVHRWEKEEKLPVHRHLHKKQGTVYAYKSEIDRWREHRGVSPEPPRRRLPRAQSILVLALAVAGAILAGYRWLLPGAPPESATGGRIMLAVLPFEYTGSAVRNEQYFSDGLTEELITELGRLAPKELAVIARTSIMRYKGTEKSAREIGEELGLDYILYGVLRRTEERLYVTIELIRLADLTRAWGETYDRPVSELMALQSDVARAVARQIRVSLTTVATREASPEAHRLFLQGRFYASKRTRPAIDKAIGFFEETIRLEPGHARAHAALADIHSMKPYYGISSPAESYPAARELALTALRLDTSLAEAHTVLASIYERWDWNWQAAETEFRLAIELNPNYARAHHLYGLFLERMGRLEEAAIQMGLALELDPVSLIIIKNVADVHYFSGRYEQAIEHYLLTLDMEADFYISRLFLGFVYEQTADFPRAIEAFRRALALDDDPAATAALAHAYALSGRKEEAFSLLAKLERSTGRYVSPYHLAIVHVALQQHDEAFVRLEQAYEKRDEWLLSILTDPRLEALRSERRYTDLLERMRLSRRASSERVQ